MYLVNGKKRPLRRRGIKGWFKRWFCCGIRRENEVMKIYLEINQLDDVEIWNSDI